MITEEDLKNVRNNPTFMNKYVKGIRLLQEAGVLNLLRKMGEPTDVDPKDPQAMNISAYDNIELRGWHKALDSVEFFIESLETSTPRGLNLDFGAEDMLSNYNFGDKT